MMLGQLFDKFCLIAKRSPQDVELSLVLFPDGAGQIEHPYETLTPLFEWEDAADGIYQLTTHLSQGKPTH